MIFYAIVILVVLYLGRKRIKAYVMENYGENYLPKDKRYLWIGFIVGALGGIVGSVFDLQGKGRATNSDEIIAYCLVAAIFGVILCAIVNAFRSNKGKGFWSRYWCNSLLFLITFFPGILVGSLLVWGAVFIVLAMLAYHGIGLHRVGIGGGSGSSGNVGIPSYNCCNSCCKYNGTHCSEQPSKSILDPDSTCCGMFSRKG